MDTFGLKSLTVLDSDDIEEAEKLIDVVAVGGRKYTSEKKWSDDSTPFEGIDDGLSSVLDLFSPEARCSSFSYDMDSLFVHSGIRDVGIRLLQDLQQLGTLGNRKREIVFVCVDVGGIVVKEALNMAMFDDPRFRSIASSISCIIFFGCPHRCKSIGNLEKSFQRLFRLADPLLELSPILSINLAVSTVGINQRFLDTGLLAKCKIVNISSQSHDLNESIFDSYETTISTLANNNVRQFLDARPHKFLDIHVSEDRHTPWLRGEVFRESQELNPLELLLPQTIPQITNASLAIEATLQSHQSTFLEDRTFQDWREGYTTKYLMILDEYDAVVTGVTIFNNCMIEAPKHSILQFFEFRPWDERYNSIEKMLCTFLTTISGFNVPSWRNKLKSFTEEALGSSVWSSQYLLSIIYECLLCRHPYGIKWILVNLDEHISSYDWLMSSLCRFSSNSDLRFSIAIVKQAQSKTPVNLGSYQDDFNIIWSEGYHNSLGSDSTDFSIKQKTKLATDDHQQAEESTHEQKVAASYNNGFIYHQKLLEYTVQLPELLKFKRQLHRLFFECERDVHLQQMLDTWMKVKAHGFPLMDLLARVDEVFPLSTEKLFPWLCLPLSLPSSYANQMVAALELMLYSFRPLTNSELKFLEEQTGYGKEIGHVSSYTASERDSAKTLVVLSGLVTIRQCEVQFHHSQFRSFLISQAGNGQQFTFVTEDGAKAANLKIAAWCIEAINKASSLDWACSQTDDEGAAVIESRKDFLSYATKYWVRHTVMARIKVNEHSSIRKLLENRLTLESWSKAYWSLSNPATRGPASYFSPLAIFAENGAEELLEISIENYRHLPSFPAQCLRALESAARANYGQIVHNLQAIVTTGPVHLDKVLIGSFTSQNLQLIQDLVLIVKENPERLRNPLDVLGWAAFYSLEFAVGTLVSLLPVEEIKHISNIPVQLALRGAGVRTQDVTQVIRKLITAISTEASVSHLQKACELGVYEAVSIFGNMLSANNSEISQLQTYPDWFVEAGMKAMTCGHSRVLKELLDLDKVKHIQDADLLISLIDDNAYTKFKCFKEIISRTLDSEALIRKTADLIETAIMSNAVSVVQHLLTLWTLPEPKPFSSLLRLAIDRGDQALDVMNVLIQKGLEIYLEDDFMLEIVQVTDYALRRADIGLILLLLKSGPPLDSPVWFPRHPLYKAAMRGSESVVKALLELKADPNLIGDEDNWTPIHAAYDSPRILGMLLEAGGLKSLNKKDSAGKSALFLACQYGHTESVKVLLEFGAKAHCYVNGNTELSIALRSRQPEAVLPLLEKGVDPLEYHSNQLNTPILHYCIRNDFVDLLKTFLDFNFDINERDKAGNTALHCINKKTTDTTLKYLIQRGSSLDILNNANETPLLLAIRCDNDKVARYLLSHGANVNIAVGQSGSALLVACHQSTFSIVKALIGNGADVNFNHVGVHGTPLHAAILREDSEDRKSIIQYLLATEELDLNQGTSYWGGYLNLACLRDNVDMIKMLVEGGANINDEDRIGRKPIHFALYRTLELVEWLRGNGADFGKSDLMERNALHFAVVSGRLNIVKYVLETTTDLIRSHDIDHWTPLMWSIRVCGHWGIEAYEQLDIVKELINHGADLTAEGEGLGRTWTAYDLAWYYNLGDQIIDAVKPSDEELKSLRERDSERGASWEIRIKGPKKKGIETSGFCDACLMGVVGIAYICDACRGFCLCFKCYRSRDIVHAEHSFHRANGDDEYEEYIEADSSPDHYDSDDDVIF